MTLVTHDTQGANATLVLPTEPLCHWCRNGWELSDLARIATYVDTFSNWELGIGLPATERPPMSEVTRHLHAHCYAEREHLDHLADEIREISDWVAKFTGAGFACTQIERMPFPDHVHEMMSAPGKPDEDSEEGVHELRYFAIQTSVGSLGMLLCPWPIIDLTGSGVTYDEMVAAGAVPPMPLEMPKEAHCMCVITDSSGFESLYRLMATKKA